jgi:hypothetical protein
MSPVCQEELFFRNVGGRVIVISAKIYTDFRLQESLLTAFAADDLSLSCITSILRLSRQAKKWRT